MQETAKEEWKQVLAYALAGVIGAGAGFLLRSVTYFFYTWMWMTGILPDWLMHIYGWIVYLLRLIYIPLGIILGIFFLRVLQKKEENHRKVSHVASKFPLILALAGVLTVVGFFAGLKMSEYRWQGLLVQWKRLPASMRFTEIVDATSYDLWAKAENGRLYTWDMLCNHDPQCGNWTQVEEIPTDVHDESTNWMERSASCNIGNFKPRGPSGQTTQCVFVYMVPGDFNITSYYALTDTGEIWYWELTSDISYFLFTVSSCTCSGAVLGLVLGVVIFYRKTAQN